MSNIQVQVSQNFVNDLCELSILGFLTSGEVVMGIIHLFFYFS